MKPCIGITVDTLAPGDYSHYPSFVLRRNYVDAVRQAGATAWLLSCYGADVPAYLARVDALVISGGDFDIDPALFTKEKRHSSVKTKDDRTSFEWNLCHEALRRDMPLLAICGGAQLLNVVLGGTLIQHIPDAIDHPLAHEQVAPRHLAGHDITVGPDTLLHRIVGQPTMSVNSAHHQSVATTGKGVRVNARADDGVIEGIESPSHRFCLGVQWHPEFCIDPGDAMIFRALAKSASKG